MFIYFECNIYAIHQRLYECSKIMVFKENKVVASCKSDVRGMYDLVLKRIRVWARIAHVSERHTHIHLVF